MSEEIVKLICVSEWLPIAYDGEEPYVSFNNGNNDKIWIRDLVRFQNRPAHRTIDDNEYIREDRFPRFIEVSADGKELRFWKLLQPNIGDEKEEFLTRTLSEIEAKPSAVEALKAEGIITTGDLLKTPRDKLFEIAKDDSKLLTDMLFVLNTVEMCME